MSVLLSKWLVVSSATTIWRSWLQGTIYRLHILIFVFYFPPILCTFHNIHVFWISLLYPEERVLSVEAPKLLDIFSIIIIHPFSLQ
jgi:hypothetical protein